MSFVATVYRSIDTELCPLEFISPIYVGCIGEHVLLWMSAQPHLTLVCDPIGGALACHYSARTKIKLEMHRYCTPAHTQTCVATGGEGEDGGECPERRTLF